MGFAQAGYAFNVLTHGVELMLSPLGPGGVWDITIESDSTLDQGGVLGIKDDLPDGTGPTLELDAFLCDGVGVICTVVPGATIGIPDSTYVIFEVLTPGSLGNNVGAPIALGLLSGAVAPSSSTGFSLDATGIGILTGGGYAFFPGVNNEDVFLGSLSDLPEPTPVPALDGHGLALLVALLAVHGALRSQRPVRRLRWIERQPGSASWPGVQPRW